MDESLKDKTVLVYDHRNYMETASRLSREFGRVLYFKPWKDTAPTTQNLIIGDGYDEFERVTQLFEVIEEVDLFVFPDIYDGDFQVYLEKQGKRVWGSRMAEKYEYKRGIFAKTLKEVGLPVAPFSKVVGVNELRAQLKDKDDCWIKVELRGDRETWQHTNPETTGAIIDAISYYYGPVKNHIDFYVFDNIKSDIEAAYDGYLVASPDLKPQFPKDSFLGYEAKNRAHILAITDYDSLNESVRDVNDKFAPKLAQLKYRCQWGTEIKISENGESNFLDATCRQPSPPGEISLEIVKNWGEIMYHGAVGDLVEMEIEKPFGVQVALNSPWAGNNYLPVPIPKELRRWVKLSESTRVDGLDWIVTAIPDDPLGGWTKHFGDVVALGDTIEDAIELVKERCEALKIMDTEIQINALVECLDSIKEGEKEGIKFTDDKIPKPGVVLGV